LAVGAFRVSRGSVSTQIGWRQAAWFRAFACQLALDEQFRLRSWDLALGSLMSLQWAVGRQLVTWYGGRTSNRRSPTLPWSLPRPAETRSCSSL
jgi:hypothetical protein